MSKLDAVEILLVEDDENDIELTMRALKTNNLANKVHVAKDGKAALDFVFHGRNYNDAGEVSAPKVIILDLKLPKMNGLEVLKLLKGDARTKEIPVVVLTSSQEGRDLDECYNLGVNSYIVKPFGFENFVRAVSTLGLYWLVINQPPLLK